jgi:hypothetical protein
VAINTLLFAAACGPIILSEEHFLRQTFGRAYEAYAARAPRFFPRLWLWRKPDQPLSWRMILRRENDSVFSTVLAFMLIGMLRHYGATGEVGLSVRWIILGSVSASVWIVLKYLKRCTKLLKARSAEAVLTAPSASAEGEGGR